MVRQGIPFQAGTCFSPSGPIEESTTVYDALEQGFDGLVALCGVVEDKFAVARDGFNSKQHP